MADRLTFGKDRRLTRSSEFRRVRESGRSRSGRYLVLGVLHLEETGETPTRAGFITTRRIGNAVTRSRCRRLMREIVRQALPDVRPGFWLVTIARVHAADAPFSVLQKEWFYLARKLGILRPSGK